MSFYNDVFIKEDEVWVTIADNKNIPLIGKGPITNPIRVSKDNYQMLLKLGYKVKEVPYTELIRKPLAKYYNMPAPLVAKMIKLEESQEEKVELPESEEVVEESTNNTVEVDEQEETQEELTEEPVQEESEEITEEDVNNMSKEQLKELLDYMEVPYKYKDTIKTLKELVINNLK